MPFQFDLGVLVTGACIFMARILDVSMGTVRTISIVHGRTRTAFFLGFIEVSVWLAVISTVIAKVASMPILAVFYALGFSTGNVVGIKLEKWIAFGHAVLRVIIPRHGRDLAAAIRKAGCAVTTFQGEGMNGPVTELYVVCRRRDMDYLIELTRTIEPEAFYITEPAGEVSKLCGSGVARPGGWRGLLRLRHG